MHRCGMIVMLGLGLLGTPSVRGNVVITVETMDADGNEVVGEVAPGTTLFVDIRLSVDGEDDPLADVWAMSFDFRAIDEGLQPDQFSWLVDSSVYGFLLTNDLPNPIAFSSLGSSSPTLVALNETPLTVATVEVVVNASGTLDLGMGADSTLEFVAGYGPSVTFSPANENVSGGTLALVVSGDAPPDGNGGGGDTGTDGGAGGGTDGGTDGANDGTGDTDGDGVADSVDAFPNDAAETVDTDGDGTGDQADLDDDGDGVPDSEDAFALDPDEQVDTDGDGVGDNAGAFPTDAAETSDGDGDGVGDNADIAPEDPTQSGLDESNSNTGPRAAGGLCGVAMLSTSIWILCGLTVISLRRRV